MQAKLLLPANKTTDRSETMCVCYTRAVASFHPPPVRRESPSERRLTGNTGNSGRCRTAPPRGHMGKPSREATEAPVRTRMEDPCTCRSEEGSGKPLPDPVGNPNKMLDFLPTYRSGLSSNYFDLKEIM